MDQTIRNKLRGVVTQCRKLLEDSTAQALQGRFGIYASRKKGEVQIEDEARMAHLTEEDRACRQDLLDHLEHIQAIGYKPSEALEQLVREISFTHLNRLCAYKMMESRGLIREAVSRGLKSQGFFFYLADHPEDEKLHNGGGQETAYRNFLDWLGGTLSQEIGVLFNPNDPANRIYPPQRVLDEVLALINDGDLKDIWSQDETIGWVYQYFTPKELRDKARKESQAPRNSYELAFRNQFFTPRYVVEFLTDNTLGRIWYEMRKGKTILKDRCKYLVRRPMEIFLKDGELPPAESKEAREDLSQEELLKQPVYIPHRPKKDPRELKVLDPACGSGHFLLYCFDLLQVIYEEAYDDPDLGAALRRDYPAIEDLRRAVPALILKHNLHGIDIDLRATQIAALALWLRCQRAYQELGLKNGERPKITRSNIVCAEPMPGETDLLKEFTSTLQPKVLGQLVEAVFEKMKLAGEAGSLLKIEEEIREAAGKAKFEFIQWKKHQDKAKWSLFPELVKRDQPSIFDFADMTDEVFLDRAEEEIVEALRRYATQAENGRGFRRRLFAEDAARGFAFIDLCRKRYDTVLMNPPFGECVQSAIQHVSRVVPHWCKNLASAFVGRLISMLSVGAKIGTVTDRTILIKSSYQDFRTQYALGSLNIGPMADLGWNVLDANVEVSAVVFSESSELNGEQLFIDCRAAANKDSELVAAIVPTNMGGGHKWLRSTSFLRLPNASIAHDMPSFIIRWFNSIPALKDGGAKALQGHAIKMDWYGRLRWEVDPSLIGNNATWSAMYNGGSFTRFYLPLIEIVRWNGDGTFLKKHPSTRWSNAERQQKPGIGYGKRGDILDAHLVPSGHVFTVEGLFVLPDSLSDIWYYLGILNSPLCSVILNFYCGQHKHAGYVDLLPVPRISDNRTAGEVIGDLAYKGWVSNRELDKSNEVSPVFVHPWVSIAMDVKDLFQELAECSSTTQQEIASLTSQLETAVESAYKLEIGERHQISELIERASSNAGLSDESDKEEEADSTASISQVVHGVVSYLLGCSVGRWDIRFATGERQCPELPDPFDPLPVCPPGMLQGTDGLPAKPEDVPSDYPIRIDWDGILVDDPGHEDDIIRRVQDVLEVIWKDRAEAIEREAWEILGVRELRDYFRKPGNGGFWMDHVKRYSKSRRKAPIYWYLRSARGNYGLWLYYHRLDKDILFKALLNYVEPKIRMEEDRLKSLRGRKEAAGSSGREAKQIEKDMDRQDQLVSELHDFADKLRRAANLHLVPDLNDGVVLTIAPLFELVPWKEAKEYWEDLVAGKYEWSSIGKQMREKGLVNK
ncbi:MAG: BREX-1 system adenine-specific DNA-methyltransferase PglX [Syntrophotaleaceae bacterium]